MTLRQFREELEDLMPNELARPFTCDGSPLDCRIVIVGLNSATLLGQPFFTRYWNDSSGFDRKTFEGDYSDMRKKAGVRPRIEAFVKGACPVRVLETNIYAVPTRKASQLRSSDKDTSIIKYLLKTIRPAGILVHSNEPIRRFEKWAGSIPTDGDGPAQVELFGQSTCIWGLGGPLFTRSLESMKEIGARMKECIGA